MGPGDAVRTILYHHLTSTFDELRGACPRSTDRQNAVRVAVNDQRGHIDARHVLAKVLVPGWHASERGRGRGASCKIPARLDSLFTNPLTQQQVSVVEILKEFSEKGVTVCSNGLLNSLEDTAVHALRIVRRLQ